MATVTPAPAWTRADADRRVRHPLQKLRGTLRTYVTLEGAATVVTYLAVWFWAGLLLDFGAFKSLGVDWVEELPWQFRLVALILLSLGLAGVLLYQVLGRLLREFRDDALALVLERRFPRELGDRLITAVELADPALGERYGYSQPMVEQTIRDAAERVDALPVGDAFDWKRLRRAGWRAAALVAVPLVVAVAALAVAWGDGLGHALTRFRNVAAIWLERNVALRDTYWPRKAHLELLDFPEAGELKIGRDAPPPPLRVRAVKWVVGDPSVVGGWRALTWSDLRDDLVTGLDLGALPEKYRGLTLDALELVRNRRQAEFTNPDVTRLVDDVLEHLEGRAAQPRLARRLRKLVVPEQVVVTYKGETVRSDQTLQQREDHEYSGTLTDLRESVRFTARAEDFATPYRRITVVPPPTLTELVRDEDRPAYLYQRPPLDGGPEDLKGKKQEFRNEPVSLSGGVSTLEVPAGTNLVLRARTDKPLQTPGVTVRFQEGSARVAVPVTQPDENTFIADFPHVTAALDFLFEFKDTDGVTGQRQVRVRPLPDQVPDVDDLHPEYVRKTAQGYLVTPVATVPFLGKIRDDHGLDALDYVYSLTLLDLEPQRFVPLAVNAFQATPAGSPLVWAVAAAVVRPPTEDATRPRTAGLASFERKLAEEKKLHAYDKADLARRLRARPERSLFRDLTLDPEEEAFDVAKLDLKVRDEKQVQPRYRLRLWVLATDNNVETGPGVSAKKDTFNVLIVSENELIVEIAKEEEGLHYKLQDVLNRLKESRIKLDQVATDLPRLEEREFSPMARRLEEILEALTKGWDVTREVHTDYRKILKELQVNRVTKARIDKVREEICNPLESAVNGNFVQTDEAARAFHKALKEKKKDPAAAKTTLDELDRLIAKLQQVLDAMGQIEILSKLIAQLIEIEKNEVRDFQRLKELRDKMEKDVFDALGIPEAPKKPEEKKEEKKP